MAQQQVASPAPSYGSGTAINNYNTQLPPDQEAQYQEYVKTLGDQGSDADFDMRGYWMKYGRFEGPHEKGSHFYDDFKKPNHMTFSDQSIYSGTSDGKGGINEGGKWIDNMTAYQPPASVANDPRRIKQLSDYLKDPRGENGRIRLAIGDNNWLRK